MPVKIRLQRRGRKKSPFYHIVVADARAPRDGRFIEKLGTYNPMTKPATIEINRDSAYEWLLKGAQPTDTARAILRFKGVMYRKHLMRGVAKGALTEEQAMVKYQQWIDAKEAKISERRAATAEEIRKFHELVNGKAPAKKAAPVQSELVDGDGPKAAEGSFADTVEQTTIESLSGDAPAAEEVAAPVVEEAPAAEAVVEEVVAPVVEEAPAADDLTVVEGIGPKIAETLTNAGIATFTQLADASVDSVKEILAANSLASHDPTTWGKQAQMAANGEWAALKTWQDELDGGKEVAANTDEG